MFGGSKKPEASTDTITTDKVNNPNDPNYQSKNDEKSDGKTDNKTGDAKIESKQSGP
jgi:hypothetical protein